MEDEAPTLRVRSTELTWREIDGQIIVLDNRTWNYMSVSGSGLDLWAALVEGTCGDGMVDLLIERYGIEPDRARADVNEFVALLDEHQLLEA